MICPDFHSKPDELKRGQARPPPRRVSTDFGGACLAGGPGLPGPRFFGAPRLRRSMIHDDLVPMNTKLGDKVTMDH